MNERENASEKMVGICIERVRTREGGRYMYRERTHTRIAMNKRERKHVMATFVISNRRYKLIEFQFVKLSKLIVII